jgi:hypothetical protein
MSLKVNKQSVSDRHIGVIRLTARSTNSEHIAVGNEFVLKCNPGLRIGLYKQLSYI